MPQKAHKRAQKSQKRLFNATKTGENEVFLYTLLIYGFKIAIYFSLLHKNNYRKNIAKEGKVCYNIQA